MLRIETLMSKLQVPGGYLRNFKLLLNRDVVTEETTTEEIIEAAIKMVDAEVVCEGPPMASVPERQF